MGKSKKSYSLVNKLSAVLMMLTLAWFTVSAPFIMSLQEERTGSGINFGQDGPLSGSEEENAGFPGANTEEKAPGSLTNLSEEFLQHHHSGHNWFLILEQDHKLETVPTYTAYHGELHVPPPNSL